MIILETTSRTGTAVALSLPRHLGDGATTLLHRRTDFSLTPTRHWSGPVFFCSESQLPLTAWAREPSLPLSQRPLLARRLEEMKSTTSSRKTFSQVETLTDLQDLPGSSHHYSFRKQSLIPPPSDAFVEAVIGDKFQLCQVTPYLCYTLYVSPTCVTPSSII